jgi:hypothetical protein
MVILLISKHAKFSGIPFYNVVVGGVSQTNFCDRWTGHNLMFQRKYSIHFTNGLKFGRIRRLQLTASQLV